jgi:hypothetical protein
MDFKYGNWVLVTRKGFYYGQHGPVIEKKHIHEFCPESNDLLKQYLVKLPFSEHWFDETDLEKER